MGSVCSGEKELADSYFICLDLRPVRCSKADAFPRTLLMQDLVARRRNILEASNVVCL